MNWYSIASMCTVHYVIVVHRFHVLVHVPQQHGPPHPPFLMGILTSMARQALQIGTLMWYYISYKMEDNSEATNTK